MGKGKWRYELMKILVLSCDKDNDTFEAFHHCIEKYYPNHPEIIYATETIKNPYYKTISYDIPLERWTERIRKTLHDIDDDKILIMMNDCFIRKKVDAKRIEYAEKHLKGNIAHICFEKSYDTNDEETTLKGFKKRQHGANYEVSINCGIWQKDKLINVLERNSTPWDIELNQDNKGYDYYINSGDYIIDWGYETWIPTGIFKGRWCRNVIPFFEQEGIKIDYGKRGFND